VASTQVTLHADPVYDFIDLGTLGGAMSQAYGVNDYGQIVGVSTLADGTQRAFSYLSGSGMTDLGTLGGASSIAYDINNLGQITGVADTSYYSADPSIYPRTSEAFLYSSGVMTGLGGLQFTTTPASGGSSHTYLFDSVGMAINNLGQVTGKGFYGTPGVYSPPGIGGFHAVSWQNGTIQQLALPTGGAFLTSAYGSAINDAGVILAISENKPFLYDGSILSALGSILGSNTIAISITDINESGMVVGIGYTASQLIPMAFVYHNGQVDILPSPSVQTIGSTYALNDIGQVVGDEVGGDDLLWNQGHFFKLNDITQDLKGFHIEHTKDINNQGQIVGWGTTSDGSTHAFMLSPVVVPEPSSLLLLATAGCLLLAGRQRRMRPRLILTFLPK
jgi:probable HAF family extracellular repeat protein